MHKAPNACKPFPQFIKGLLGCNLLKGLNSLQRRHCHSQSAELPDLPVPRVYPKNSVTLLSSDKPQPEEALRCLQNKLLKKSR